MTFLPQNLPKFITFFSKNIEFDLDFDLKRDVVGFMIEMSRVQVLRMSRVQVRKEKGLG